MDARSVRRHEGLLERHPTPGARGRVLHGEVVVRERQQTLAPAEEVAALIDRLCAGRAGPATMSNSPTRSCTNASTQWIRPAPVGRSIEQLAEPRTDQRSRHNRRCGSAGWPRHDGRPGGQATEPEAPRLALGSRPTSATYAASTKPRSVPPAERKNSDEPTRSATTCSIDPPGRSNASRPEPLSLAVRAAVRGSAGRAGRSSGPRCPSRAGQLLDHDGGRRAPVELAAHRTDLGVARLATDEHHEELTSERRRAGPRRQRLRTAGNALCGSA